MFSPKLFGHKFDIESAASKRGQITAIRFPPCSGKVYPIGFYFCRNPPLPRNRGKTNIHKRRYINYSTWGSYPGWGQFYINI